MNARVPRSAVRVVWAAFVWLGLQHVAGLSRRSASWVVAALVFGFPAAAVLRASFI